MALNNHVENFTLDMAPGGIAPVLNVSQGDTGRAYTADMYWGGASYDVSGLTVRLRGRKRDNTVFDYALPAPSGTKVAFDLADKEQVTIIPGNVECELVFTDSNSRVVGTANFMIIVEEAPYGPAAPSESVVQGLVDLIEETVGGDISDEVDAWLDAHPEATTTVQDGAVTTPKLANGAVTPAKMANFSTDYKSNAGIVDQLNALNSNIATAQTMDAEYMALGGEFGTGKTEAQRLANTTALQELFSKYNAICFKCLRQIETLNFSAEIKTYSNIQNVHLFTYYNENTDAVLYSATIARFTNFYNVLISNQSLEYCKCGTLFGSLSGYSTIGTAYTSFDAIRLIGFDYPLVLFTFNCNLGEIHINSCKYGAILLGTSINGGALYMLNCANGSMLGCYIDENGTLHNSGNAYLRYSNIGIISVDSTQNIDFALGVGNVRDIIVGSLAYEGAHLNNIINGYTPNTSFLGLDILTMYPQGMPTGKFYNNVTTYNELVLNIGQIFAEYIQNAITNSDPVRGTIKTSNYYMGKSTLSAVATNTPVTVASIPQKATTYFQGILGNAGGTANNVRGFYSKGTFCGTLNKGETLCFDLRSSQSPQSSYKRSYFLQAKITISDNNQYNSNTYKTNTEILINVNIDSFTQGGDYTNNIKTSTLPAGFAVTIDSSGEHPVVKLTGPAPTGSTPATYVFNAEVIGGYETNVYME